MNLFVFAQCWRHVEAWCTFSVLQIQKPNAKPNEFQWQKFCLNYIRILLMKRIDWMPLLSERNSNEMRDYVRLRDKLKFNNCLQFVWTNTFRPNHDGTSMKTMEFNLSSQHFLVANKTIVFQSSNYSFVWCDASSKSQRYQRVIEMHHIRPKKWKLNRKSKWNLIMRFMYLLLRQKWNSFDMIFSPLNLAFNAHRLILTKPDTVGKIFVSIFYLRTGNEQLAQFLHQNSTTWSTRLELKFELLCKFHFCDLIYVQNTFDFCF